MSFVNKNQFLLPLLSFTGILLAGRIIHTHTIVFLFIPWNLLLAFVPLYFSYQLNHTGSKKTQWLFLALWLLFFPNSMYIITDLFHLHERVGMPQWYDLLILFSAALNGLVMGFLSVVEVEEYLSAHIHTGFIRWVVLSFFFLSGYGIYLGRYLRWNSWSIITRPLSLLYDIRQDVFHPIRHDQSWMMSILFGIWLYILYKYFKKFKAGFI